VILNYQPFQTNTFTSTNTRSK